MRNNKYLKISFVPIVLVAAACFNQVLAAENLFNGNWIYEQTCGWKHVASVRLHQNGSQVNGDWSDGSARGSGISGQLKGSISNKKLIVRYCGIDENSDSNVCPNFDSESSDYFIRQRNDLVWYKMTIEKNGNGFRKYLVLHPEINGKPEITDSNCVDE